MPHLPVPLRLTMPLALVLLAGAVSAETVRFRPGAGTARSYSLDISARADTRGYVSPYRRSFRTYLDVTPASGGDEPVLHLTPKYVALDDNGSWSSSPVARQWSEELSRLQSTGYDLTVAGDGPARTNLESARPGLEARAGALAGRLHAGLADPFAAPGFPVPVEASRGWTTMLAGFAGYEDVTIEVTRVTGRRVYLSFEGGTGGAEAPAAPEWFTRGHRIAGLAVLDRDSGWIVRQVVTREGRMAIRDRTLPARITTVLVPLVTGEAGFAPSGGQMDRPDELDDRSLWPNLHAASEDRVLPADKASFEPLGEVMLLGFPADVDRPEQVGSVTFEDLRLEDADGTRIELNAHVGPVYTLPDFGAENALISTAQVTPNVIGPVDLDEVARATARVSWYPPTTRYVEVQPDGAGRASLSEHGLQVDLRPWTEPGTYLLRYAGQPGDWLNWILAGDSSGTATIFAYDRGPGWLSPGESQVRMFASPTPEGQTVILRTDDKPMLRFRIDRPAAQAQVSREMTFHRRSHD